ncbi:hypothetical protein Acr_03g0006400 [Actinidia rufa]|uniref:Uncharacterized protein n=1 Tax=Actinidia rufa TaxID=165716 RepID=A0A7J0ECG1_9ERIC|nr:hypothetical protein Acr_03g0006400 [Actinidia rufa]
MAQIWTFRQRSSLIVRSIFLRLERRHKEGGDEREREGRVEEHEIWLFSASVKRFLIGMLHHRWWPLLFLSFLENILTIGFCVKRKWTALSV